MSLAGQRPSVDRFAVIPRTLVFLQSPGHLLLQRTPEARGAWGGQWNGVGGHIEAGEDPLSGARREVREETGLEVEALYLCGVVLVDTGTGRGIGLYVFAAELDENQEPSCAAEGETRWVPVDELKNLPLVEDLPVLLPKVLDWYPGRQPFCAAYSYDRSEQLQIRFGV